MQVAEAADLPKWPGIWSESVRRGAIMRDDDGAAAAQEPARWITAIAARQDRAAFAALFGFYAPRIKAMLMRSGAPADTAEDIAQETLITVWRKAAYFDPARASAAAWIYTIARNLRVDRLRRDKLAKLYARDEAIEPEGPERPDSALVNCRRNKSASCNFRSSKAAPTAISPRCSICRLARSNRGSASP
jgi:RNA polymerase sigma factor (sigma-70 family)